MPDAWAWMLVVLSRVDRNVDGVVEMMLDATESYHLTREE